MLEKEVFPLETLSDTAGQETWDQAGVGKGGGGAAWVSLHLHLGGAARLEVQVHLLRAGCYVPLL